MLTCGTDWIDDRRARQTSRGAARACVRSRERDDRRVPHGRRRVFALEDRVRIKGGPLSQGIVHGRSVTCPLHNWVIDLASGEATAPDDGLRATVAARDARPHLLARRRSTSTARRTAA